MKIAFSGSQGTGKSTLFNQIKEWDIFKNYYLSSGLARKAQKDGYLINEKGDDESQLAILDLYLHDLDRHPNLLAERSIVDLHIYILWLYLNGVVIEDTMKTIFDIAHTYYVNYDIIFFLKPEFSIEQDGIRSIDKKYQDEINSLFEKYYSSVDSVKPRVVILTGSVQDRLEQIYNTIEEFNDKSHQWSFC